MKKYSLYYIFILGFTLPSLVFGGEPCTDELDISYACYKKNVAYYCDESGPWESNGFLDTGTLKFLEKFPEMESKSVQEKKQALEESAARNRTLVYIPPTSSYQLDIIKVSNQIYHTEMNTIFSCAMISSRIKIAKTIIESINKQFGNKSSEIVRKIEKMNQKLETLKPKSCKGTEKAGEEPKGKDGNILPMRLRLLDTASYQYCTYRYYLEYVQKNVNIDFAKTKKEMNDYRKLDGEAPQSPRNTAEIAFELDKMNREIRTEIDTAKRTYPVAIAAYVEMERTYSVHLLLQFIQSDYLDLRKNLRDLLNPLSQLFYKVLNAQSANKG